MKQPRGWLNDWAAELESGGCLAPHEGWKLAQRILESLPLEPNTGFRLLYGTQMDIAPQIKLQVVSPILREGARSQDVAEPVEIAGEGPSLTLTAKSAANLIGYETAWYSVQPKLHTVGFSIAPLSAESHIAGDNKRRPGPSVDYLRFPPEAAFYRLYHKAGETEFTQLVLAARTLPELKQRVIALDMGMASCEKLNGELCITIPKAVAVNIFLPVTVNRVEIPVRWGSTVGEAIRESGVRQASSILPQLAVYRPYGGQPTPVEFDHTSPAILNLILTGGEVISWK
jgi:hypothetical protein